MCPRSTCTLCVEVPADFMEELGKDEVSFQCVYCHWRADIEARRTTPYLVRARLYIRPR